MICSRTKVTTRPRRVLALTYRPSTDSYLLFLVIKTRFILKLSVTVFTKYSNPCEYTWRVRHAVATCLITLCVTSTSLITCPTNIPFFIAPVKLMVTRQCRIRSPYNRWMCLDDPTVPSNIVLSQFMPAYTMIL